MHDGWIRWCALSAVPFPKALAPSGQLLEFDAVNQDIASQVVKSEAVSKLIMGAWFVRPRTERPLEYETVVEIHPESTTPLILEEDGFHYRVDQLCYRVNVRVAVASLVMSLCSSGSAALCRGLWPCAMVRKWR